MMVWSKVGAGVGWACRPVAIVVLAVAGLAGCGGGGGGPEPLAVNAITPDGARYGQTLRFTVDGTSLDADVTLSTTACAAAPVRSTTAPDISSDTQAYYTCTATATGTDRSVSASHPSAGVLLTQTFTVPEPQVTMTLSNGAGVVGDVVFTLKPNLVQATVDNFLRYVGEGFYVGTVFHRVVPGLVAHGGRYTPWGTGTPVAKATHAPIALQVGSGLNNTALTLAMARGPGADTATAEFFVNLDDNRVAFDPNSAFAGYAVFGELTAGQAVLDALVAAPCAPLSGFSECVPNPAVVITAAAQSR